MTTKRKTLTTLFNYFLTTQEWKQKKTILILAEIFKFSPTKHRRVYRGNPMLLSLQASTESNHPPLAPSLLRRFRDPMAGIHIHPPTPYYHVSVGDLKTAN